MADDKAAFGVFPQMKPKRSKQDREAAKNVPIDLARGFVSGALGMPGDIESLARIPYDYFRSPTMSELVTGEKTSKTFLPTSEDIEKRLPFGSDTPVGRAAAGAGQIGGGFYTGPLSGARAITAVPKAVMQAGKDFLMAAPQGAPRIFIGPKAKTWDQAKADAAIRMEKEGADPVDIWRQTGTFRGADGILRQEISDQPAKFLTPEDRALRIAENKLAIDKLKEQIAPTPQKDLFPKALTEAKKEAREDISLLKGENKMRERNPRTQGLNAEYIFEHPELYAAYPELRNVRITTEGGSGSTKGALNIIPSHGQIPGVMEMDIYDKALRSDPASTALHEMQHAVQTLEGMHPGGSPTMAFGDPKAFEILKRKREELATPMTIDEFRKGIYGRDAVEPERLEKAYKDYLSTYKVSPQIDRIAQEEAAIEYYKRLGGEAEARAAQERQMMSPFQRRQEFPYSSYDIPSEDIIVKPPREFKDGGSVHFSDNPDSQMLDMLDKKMAEGGAAYNTEPDMSDGGKIIQGPAFADGGDVDKAAFGIYPKQRATPSSEETKKGAKQAAEVGAELVFPQDAVDVGMMLIPGGKVARKLGAALIAGGASTEAEAGILKRLAKAAKAAKEEPSLPLNLSRAPAKTKEEIRPIAQRMAEQMTGEFIRPNPKKSVNPAGKSFKQFQMEKELTHDIRPAEGKTLLPQDVADIEKQLGMLKIGVSGDTTIADKVLHRAGPYKLDLPSPQHGGPLYGLGGEGAWASNNPTAATFQKRVQELSQAHGDAPTLGQFVAMGPEGSYFALHLADANLQAIDLSKMTKRQIEQTNNIIRQGTPKSGPRPGFPGIEDKESAYLHFAFDPELRKAFNMMMSKPDYTSKLNLPDGRIIQHAITEPELRNTEILTSGLSQMRLDPSVNPADLALSMHPTYSHVIPKVPESAITRTKYPTPAEIEFPDVEAYIRANVPEKSHTRMYQTATPRQIVDPQHIDEIKMYEELMKEYTGYKKGGEVKKPDDGLIKVQKKRKAKA